MYEIQTEELSLREMLAKARITQKKIAEEAKVSSAVVFTGCSWQVQVQVQEDRVFNS